MIAFLCIVFWLLVFAHFITALVDSQPRYGARETFGKPESADDAKARIKRELAAHAAAAKADPNLSEEEREAKLAHLAKMEPR